MNILSVVDTLREISGKTAKIKIIVYGDDYKRGLIYGGINEHTTLTSLNFGARWRNDFALRITLSHKCPISRFNNKNIRKAPYYCKNCAQCIISADQGPGMGLPVDLRIVPKMQISLAGMSYKSDPTKDLDIGDMVLTRYNGWVHKCTKLSTEDPYISPYIQGKQTLTKLPFKCKECKKPIGEEGFDFKKMVAIASVLRATK